MNNKQQAAADILLLSVREKLIYYFGDVSTQRALQRTVPTELIGARTLPDTRHGSPHQYLREAAIRDNQVVLMFRGKPILSVGKEPARMVVHTSSMKESLQTNYVLEKLPEFLQKYLPKVEVTENAELVLG
jgi:hypothetical protein